MALVLNLRVSVRMAGSLTSNQMTGVRFPLPALLSGLLRGAAWLAHKSGGLGSGVRISPSRPTGSGSAWKSTRFGSERSQVQILPTRLGARSRPARGRSANPLKVGSIPIWLSMSMSYNGQYDALPGL